jgi:hypothetical protein
MAYICLDVAAEIGKYLSPTNVLALKLTCKNLALLTSEPFNAVASYEAGEYNYVAMYCRNKKPSRNILQIRYFDPELCRNVTGWLDSAQYALYHKDFPRGKFACPCWEMENMCRTCLASETWLVDDYRRYYG